MQVTGYTEGANNSEWLDKFQPLCLVHVGLADPITAISDVELFNGGQEA
jgi:hypothetical protein